MGNQDSFKTVDRRSAGDKESPGGASSRDEPGRPSVEEKLAHYWSGPGWDAAFKEVTRLLKAGFDKPAAARCVGWTEDDLNRALANGGAPLGHKIPPKRDRPRRTIQERVASLNEVKSALSIRAKRLYEIEIMTVREVAEVVGLPYEKTYLILIAAGTKFRKPGRRPS